MRLRRTNLGPVLERDGEVIVLDDDWDDLFRLDDIDAHLAAAQGTPSGGGEVTLAPVGRQEVWAAGITYYASRDARMEESESSGSADVYQRCYDAERPELFLKATPHRVVGPGQPVRIRRDSHWNVPEPELTLAISATGKVFGYTIGNDMSSRDIEGANPLYLPQAKIYDGCAALGPAILITDTPPAGDCSIALLIERHGAEVFTGATTVSRIRRTFAELVEYLHRDSTFPDGCFLLTGTGVVPPPDFTLEVGDVITITIDGIGSLTNPVEQAGPERRHRPRSSAVERRIPA